MLIVPITFVLFQFPMCLLYMNTTIKSHLHKEKKSIKVYLGSKRVVVAASQSNNCIGRHRTTLSARFNHNCAVSVSHKSQQHGHDNHGHKTSPSSRQEQDGQHGGTFARKARKALVS